MHNITAYSRSILVLKDRFGLFLEFFVATFFFRFFIAVDLWFQFVAAFYSASGSSNAISRSSK
jgi:hypothetical protein